MNLAFALARRLVLLTLSGFLCLPVFSQIQLRSTDWLNRGRAERCEVLENRGLVFVQMDRGIEDRDLSVFQWRPGEADRLDYLGTVQAFGHSIARSGSNLVSIKKERGLCLWDMSNPLNPKILSGIPDGPKWGSEYTLLSDESRLIVFGAELTEYRRIGNSFARVQRSDITDLREGHWAPDAAVEGEGVIYTGAQNLGTLRLSALQRASNGTFQVGWQTREALPGSFWFRGGVRLCISPDHRYLLASNLTVEGGESSLLVYSLENPLRPVLVSRVALATAGPQYVLNMEFVGDRRVAISGSRIFVADLDEAGRLTFLPDSQKGFSSTCMRWVNGRLYLGGWYQDLQVLRLDAMGRPSVVTDADPHLGLECMTGDAGIAYIMSERKEARRCILNAYRTDPVTGRLGPPEQLLDVASYGNAHMGISVHAGQVAATDGRNLYLLSRGPDGSHRLTDTTRVRGGFSWPPEHEPISRCANHVRVGRDVFGVDLSGRARLLAQPQWAERSLLMDEHAVVPGAGQLAFYRLPDFALVGSVAASPLKMQVQGRSLLYHETNSIKEVSISDSGALQLWDLTPLHRPYPGEHNLTVTEDLVLSWYWDTCDLYARSKNKGRLQFLGSSPMTDHLCHGGWYGFASKNMFFTADAFAGVNAFQIRRLFERSTLHPSDPGAELRWLGLAGTRYQPMESSDLMHWWPVGSPVRGAGRSISVRPGGAEPYKFYGVLRVQE